ncbi:MAG: hypothetical protein ABJP44_19615 [Sulfitobacter sp.]|uniref:hypothetical protein n=1 Tax=Sulfitobacter sp. TaxID=1903071 RepID=UPI00329A3AF9
MKLFSTLKRRMAKRLAGSSLVQNAVLERLESDPKAMAKLGKKPAVFEHILAGAALSEGAVTRIIDHPAVLQRIMRSPKVFEKLLAEVSSNPESLYRILSKQSMRKVLSAQNQFLNKIGLEKTALEQVLQSVPSLRRGEAIRMLIGDDADVLRDLGETPERMAAALLYRSAVEPKNVKELAATDKIILDGVIDTLESSAPSVVLEMVKTSPDLFETGALRDQAIRSIVSNAENMSKLCALYVVTPKNGRSLGERARKLMGALLSDPVFVQALIQSHTLRLNMLHIIEDSAKAAGHTIPDMLATPRHGKAKPATT